MLPPGIKAYAYESKKRRDLSHSLLRYPLGMDTMRDDFDEKTKEILSRRVGLRCSNPNCRKLTNGPQIDPSKAINIGVAAHITAASQNGPRFDTTMTPEERKSAENGIWLCQNCAKLIDNDERRYSKDLLIEWKRLSERAALLEVENLIPPPSNFQSNDLELLRFYSQCFDRPAFQDPFREEGSMEAFDKAIEDTITAINTGALRSRDGVVLAQAKGKSYISNHEWRNRMDLFLESHTFQTWICRPNVFTIISL